MFNDFYCNESDYLGLFRDAYISVSMLFLNFCSIEIWKLRVRFVLRIMIISFYPCCFNIKEE